MMMMMMITSNNGVDCLQNKQNWILYHLKWDLIGCVETSVRYYYYRLRNNPEERGSDLLRFGNLNSHKHIK